MDSRAEWLETDGLGGFASGTASGIRTRRYHALLLCAQTPPTGRTALVNGFEAFLAVDGRTIALSSQHYAPEVIHPDGAGRIASFTHEPWPRWTYRIDDRSRVEHELFAVSGAPLVALAWRLVGSAGARGGAVLRVRPLLSGRDYHALHNENPAFTFAPEPIGDGWRWRPYPGVPAISMRANATYHHAPVWYRNFCYAEERDRGLDFTEDLAAPGTFSFDLGAGDAVWLLAAEGAQERMRGSGAPVERVFTTLRDAESERRDRLGSSLQRAADAYVVRRGAGRTLIAGYPWFTDWGRDTFIALRGICLATGWLDLAGEILPEWAGAVSDGMLPKRFADRGDASEFNAVDASLWYAVAVGEYLQMARPAASVRTRLEAAVRSILDGEGYPLPDPRRYGRPARGR